eukprot:1145222-Pelagomonas_calceolata.AAC.8
MTAVLVWLSREWTNVWWRGHHGLSTRLHSSCMRVLWYTGTGGDRLHAFTHQQAFTHTFRTPKEKDTITQANKRLPSGRMFL